MRHLSVMKHFTFYLAVAEELSFHRAAARLNIAQSALSRRIADLERELGNTLLFERQARGVKLTEAGKLLLADVRRILGDVDAAARRVARSADGTLGTLRVSFSEGMVRQALLGRALKQFRSQYPGIELKFSPMTSDLQREKLRSGEIDVGFVYQEADDPKDFNVSAVGLDRIVAVVPRNHRLAGREDAQLADLAEDPMIWPSRLHSPRLFGRLTTAFGSAGIMPDIAAEVAAVDIAHGLVAAGLGVALVIAPKGAPVHDEVVLVPVSGLPPPIPLSLIWRKGEGALTVANFVDTVETMRDGSSVAGEVRRDGPADGPRGQVGGAQHPDHGEEAVDHVVVDAEIDGHS